MTSVSGKIGMVGAGTWDKGETLRSVVEVGDRSLRQVRVCDFLGNYLEPGTEVVLTLGKMIGCKHWLLAIRIGRDHIYRAGVGGFLLLNMANLFMSGIASSVPIILSDAIGIAPSLILSIAIFSYGLFRFASNLFLYAKA